tara:strand:- start:20 stop:424 length:405 start_codon:yes stop_codon:yes gene_type:complete
MAIGISPALPMDYDQLDGPYRLTKSIKEAITQNFKHLLFTNPGERIMNPDFGIGIKRYLFELENLGTQSEIISNMRSQVKKYLNSVSIIDIKFSSGSTSQADQISIENTNAIYINILFKILPLESINVLTLPLF